MSISKYEFLLKNAHLPGEPKRFTDALIASGRFWRNERGLLKFKIADDDYLTIEHRHALKEILASGDALVMSGDDLDVDMAWLWFTSRKFTFPRMNPERPWNPEPPLPVRYVGRTGK